MSNKKDKYGWMENKQPEVVRLAMKHIDTLGLPTPSAPSKEMKNLSIPQNMNRLTPEQLSRHLASWANAKSYAIYHEATEESCLVAVKAEILEKKRLHFREFGKTDKRTITEKEAEVMLLPDMKKLLRYQAYKEGVYKILRALRKGYEEKYAAISREISRREAGQGWD